MGWRGTKSLGKLKSIVLLDNLQFQLTNKLGMKNKCTDLFGILK